MVTVTVVSDLHLEARPLELEAVLEPGHRADVLCLLGDIGDPASPAYRDFIAAVAARFPTVLLLAGNNEYRNRPSGHHHHHHQQQHSSRGHDHGHGHGHSHHGHQSGSDHHRSRSHSHSRSSKPRAGAGHGEGGEGGGEGGDDGDGSSRTPGQRGAAESRQAAEVHAHTQGTEKRSHSRSHHHSHSHSHSRERAEPAGRSMGQTEELIRAVAAAHPNVHFLQDATHVVGHVAFIGATLWSHLPDDPLPLPPTESVSGGGAPPTMAAEATAEAPVAAPEAAASEAAAAEPTAAAPEAAASASAAESRGDHGAPVSGTGQPLHVPGGSRAAVAERRDTPRGSEEQAASLATDIPVPSPAPDAPGGGSPQASSPPLPVPMILNPRVAALVADAGCSPLAQLTRQMAQSLPAPLPQRLGLGCTPPAAAAAGAGGSYTCGGGSGSYTGGSAAGGRVCALRRRLLLRRNISLSSLPPDAPCPSLFITPREASTNSQGSQSTVSDSSTGRDSSSGSGSGGESSSDSLADSSSSSGGSSSEGEAEGDGSTTPAPAAPQVAAGTALQAAGLLAAAQLSAPSEAPEPTPAPATHGGAADAALPAAAAAEAAGGASGAGQAASAPDAPASQSVYHHGHHHHHHPHHRLPSSSGTPAAATTPPPPTTVREYIGATSLDYRRILSAPGGPPITPDTTNALFAASVQYISAAVAAARRAGLVPVVLSHHAPSLAGTSHPRFAGHPSTHAYGSDLEPLLEASGVAAWYCGHTHHNFDRTLRGNVRLASNQFGSQSQPAQGYSRAWRHEILHRPPTDSSDSAAPAVAAQNQALPEAAPALAVAVAVAGRAQAVGDRQPRVPAAGDVERVEGPARLATAREASGEGPRSVAAAAALRSNAAGLAPAGVDATGVAT